MTNILRYLFSVACIAYVLWGIDFKTLLNSFTLLSVQSVLTTQAILLLCFIPLSFRFVLIARGESNFLTSFRAVGIGIATNTILPVKLGEIAKAVVLNKSTGMTMAHSMSAVFWERFADLNCLLLIGIITAAMLNMPLALLLLATVVGALQTGLICLRYKPQWLHTLIDILPGESIRNFTRHTLDALSEKMRLSDYIKLGVITIVIWSIFAGFIFYFLSVGTNLNLTNAQIMTVIVASILGLAIPAAPAGIGIYKTLVVGALIMAGVVKEQALALALALHIIQIVLPTLIGICLMPGVSFRPKELQNKLSHE